MAQPMTSNSSSLPIDGEFTLERYYVFKHGNRTDELRLADPNHDLSRRFGTLTVKPKVPTAPRRLNKPLLPKRRAVRRTPTDYLAATAKAREAYTQPVRQEQANPELLKSNWAPRDHDQDVKMADVDRRGDERRYGNGGGGYNRKRRYREDDEADRPRYDDRRPQRRRYNDEPPSFRVKKQILQIAESPMRDPVEDCSAIAKNIIDSWEDEKFKAIISDIIVQTVTEQPLKVPYVAAIVLNANDIQSDIGKLVIEKTGQRLQETLAAGQWRSFKLLLRFLACMHSVFEGDGAIPLLDELFNKAADLQTASSDDALGLELVKIIMLTIPYMLTTSTDTTKQQAAELLGKTEIIALAPSEIETAVQPYVALDNQEAPQPQGVIGLLQKQLQGEADEGWPLSFIPRLFKTSNESMDVEGSESKPKHTFPTISIPQDLHPGLNPPFPEVYFSMYADQDVETVPSTNKLAASLIRDTLTDTIDALDFNRHVAAKYLIDLDCYWAPNTFIKRATPFDKVRDAAEEGKSTWKPEDLAVDAIFSLMFKLPVPEHKLVYYHSIITETCKLAPGSIAPSLGRAIRFLYKNLDFMDVELFHRFVDWFSHHLSNFDFRWKWAEWISDIGMSNIHPRKAFIVGLIDKEIRLSFAKRIRDAIPEEYHVLIPASKDNEIPEYKYGKDSTPHSAEAKKLVALIRSKAADADEKIGPILTAIEGAETSAGISAADATLASTDAYISSICYIGSKSLSHVLSYIERCRDRLTKIGQSPEGRAQIISSVANFWSTVQAGVAVNIVDKLLNYSILTPSSVVQWALDAQRIQGGKLLAETWVYEMVERTINKVIGRIHQIIDMRLQPVTAQQIAQLEKALADDSEAMRALFREVDDALAGIAEGAGEGMLEDADTTNEADGDRVKDDMELARQWGVKWRRAWARKLAVEETRLREVAKVFPPPKEDVMEGLEEVKADGEEVKVEEANGVDGANGAAKEGEGDEIL